jgi:hypothetical protein
MHQRAIEHGLDPVKKGIIWRVGSGSKIQIWHDTWIPRPPSRKISLRKGRTRLRWVSQLMTPGRREWDEQILRTCFYNHDIDEIKKIRLSDRLKDYVRNSQGRRFQMHSSKLGPSRRQGQMGSQLGSSNNTGR